MAANLDPLDVTRSLRLPPDHQHRNGEPRLIWSRSGNVIDNGVYRSGLWSMSSEQHIESPRLQTHLEWLLLQLEPRAEVIAALQATGAKVDFFCYTLGTSPKPPAVPQSIRNRAKKLDIEIGIDHYVGDSVDKAV